jgi:DNA-binding response OmpR family regulator
MKSLNLVKSLTHKEKSNAWWGKNRFDPKEFDLLYLFMSNPGISYSRETLLNLVWGYEFSVMNILSTPYK